MAYQLRDEKGVKICKDGVPVMVSNSVPIELKEVDESEKSFVAVASTEHEDRDKDIIRQDGWDLQNFKKNPVVPWSHNYYELPVAKSIETWVDKSNIEKGPRLLFKPKFDSGDDNSMKIFNKYVNGFLTSFSVGFKSTESQFRDEDDRWYGGLEFLQQELLEISAVSVPANPHANIHMDAFEGKKNLVQLGYPDRFAKTESGLFYPVVDVVLFTEPEVIDVVDGVKAIKAQHLDSDLPELEDPVAYVFDPEKFDDKTANEWIKDCANQEYRVRYFDLKTTTGGFELEEINEDQEIQTFETSVDLVGEKDEDGELLFVMDDVASKLEEEENDELADTVVDKLVHSDVFEDMVNSVKNIQTAVTEVDDRLKSVEKTLAKVIEVDNKDNKNEELDPDETIELDVSLIEELKNTNKTDSDDSQKIDVPSVDEKELQQTIGDVLRENLRKNFRVVVNEVSGKID